MGRRDTDESTTGVDRVVWWLLGLSSGLIMLAVTAFTAATRQSVKDNTMEITNLKVQQAVMATDLKYIREGVDSVKIALTRGKK